jgi:RNA recognition motif-containing protein
MPVRLFVGNLPYTVQEADIREHFAAVGQASQVLIPVDRETGRMRGFAFVDFDDPAVAEAAARTLDGQPMNGRPLTVREARPRGEHPSPSRPQPGAPMMSSPAGAAARPAGGRPGASFGPNDPPKGRGKPRRYQSERAPKGPLRVRSGGRVFDIDEDSRGDVAEVDDTALTPGGEAEPNDTGD